MSDSENDSVNDWWFALLWIIVWNRQNQHSQNRIRVRVRDRVGSLELRFRVS